MGKKQNDADNIRIGRWMAEKRAESGMSQQAVADRLGVTRTAVHYWESGKRTIYAVNFMEYCKAIGANPEEIVRDLYSKK